MDVITKYSNLPLKEFVGILYSISDSTPLSKHPPLTIIKECQIRFEQLLDAAERSKCYNDQEKHLADLINSL
jgi:hypothetical protein